jgi:hypothetical protein
MGGILIPKVLTKSTKSGQKSTQSTNSKKATQQLKSLEELGIPLDLNLFKQDIMYSQSDKFGTIAWTTLDECKKLFFGHNKVYSKDDLIKITNKCKSSSDLKNKVGTKIDSFTLKQLCISSGNYYGYNGLSFFNEITKHFNNKRFVTDIKSAKKTVLKYNKISDVPYKLKRWIEKHNLRDIMYKHMNFRNEWTEEQVIQEAKKYIKRVDFQKAPGSAYKAAIRLNILEKVCAHMVQNKKWTIEEVKRLQKGFKYDIDFRKAYPSAHSAAHRFGLKLKMMVK